MFCLSPDGNTAVQAGGRVGRDEMEDPKIHGSVDPRGSLHGWWGRVWGLEGLGGRVQIVLLTMSFGAQRGLSKGQNSEISCQEWAKHCRSYFLVNMHRLGWLVPSIEVIPCPALSPCLSALQLLSWLCYLFQASSRHFFLLMFQEDCSGRCWRWLQLSSHNHQQTPPVLRFQLLLFFASVPLC